MKDYGRPVQFGFFLTPEASNYRRLIETSQQLERLGFDLVGIQDHPYQPRFLDTWTLLAMIAANTERLRIFPDVANLPLRPPAVLAKSAATLDLLSGGRFELGLGAGAFWEAIGAMGGPVRVPREAFGALEEAISVIRAMWSQERAVSFQGKYYQLKGVHPGPAPAHPIDIWLGAYGPRMIDLVGRKADGWIPSLGRVSLTNLKDMQQRIDDAAAKAGRNPADIRRLANIGGRITDVSSSSQFEGPVNQWVNQLAALVLDYGFDTFVLAMDDFEQARRFSQEIIPIVRQLVAQQRS